MRFLIVAMLLLGGLLNCSDSSEPTGELSCEPYTSLCISDSVFICQQDGQVTKAKDCPNGCVEGQCTLGGGDSSDSTDSSDSADSSDGTDSSDVSDSTDSSDVSDSTDASDGPVACGANPELTCQGKCNSAEGGIGGCFCDKFCQSEGTCCPDRDACCSDHTDGTDKTDGTTDHTDGTDKTDGTTDSTDGTDKTDGTTDNTDGTDGTDQSDGTDGQTVTCTLIDNTKWQEVTEDNGDPFWSGDSSKKRCGFSVDTNGNGVIDYPDEEKAMYYEDSFPVGEADALWYTITTATCNYATLSQPLLNALPAKSKVAVRFYHTNLKSSTGIYTLTLAVGKSADLIYEHVEQLKPGKAWVEAEFSVEKAYDKGTELFFNVTNHGPNEWNIMDIKATLKDQCEPGTEMAK